MDNRAKIDIAGESTTVTPPTPAADGRLGFAHRFTSWLRDPSWLTVQRVTFYSGVLLLAYLAAAIAQLFHSHHMIFESGACVGGDFVNPYAASIAALKGDPASVYDIHRQHLQEVAVMGGKDFGVLGFHYPPMYLLIVLPLSMLPFIASWVVFEAVTLGGYLAVLRRIAPVPLGLWLAITFPAVIINFMCGQNGFLTTALTGGGLLLLDRWPLLAGFLFGLMAYKPQFAILIPLALIAGRRWRALIATAISTILFAAASLAVFGAPAWRAFVGSIAFTQKIVLERGAINFPMLQSIFGAIRMWGGSVEVAYVSQAVVAIYAASAVVWVWQTRRPFALKAATVAVGSLMVSPYVLQYDLVLLAIPIAWLAMEGFEKGFLPYEKAVLSVAWILPRVSLPVSQSAKIPIAPIVIIALLTAILRRASYREPTADQEQALHLADFETPAPLVLPGLGQSS
ncbi:MAG: glycosyltransferase family 87 protein [Candidatus Binatus sp.]|uniref:glycosyltransferase family 87 protein n=1 Tax=Candidatus Binatus sp. TaxID=2811406 RepID=UPI003C72EF64